MPPGLRFLRIYGENVCSYRRFDLNLERRGMVLCTGLNGSGKSTPWHALTHLFYGWTSKGQRGASLRNIHTDGEYLFRVEAEVRGQRYAFEEHGSASKAEVLIYEGGTNVTPAAGSRAAVREILGWSKERFLSTCYLSQEHTHLLVEATRAERREYTRELFALGVYKDLEHATKDRLEAATALAMGSPVLKDGVTRCEAAIADLKPTAELERRHAAALRFLKESQAQIQELDDKIPGLEQLRSRVELREQLELERAELPKPTDALAVLEHRSEQLATKVAKSEASEEARAKAETAKRDLTKLGALRDRAVVVEDLREVRRKLAASQAVEAGVRKATDYAAQLSRLRVDEPTDEIEERVEQKAERAKELGREADDLLKRIETGVCPRCRRPWNVSEEEAKKLQERLEAVRLELAPITADVHRDRGLLKDARRRDEIRTALNNLPDGDLDTWRSNNAKLHAREREYVSELERVERADRLRTIVDQPAAEAVDLKSLREHLKRMKQALEEARAHQYLGQRIEKLPTGDVAKVQTRLEGLRDRRAALDSRRQRAREVTAQTAADLQLRERLEHELADYRQRYEQTQKAGQRVRAYQVLQKGWRHLLEARERQKLSRIQELLHNYLEPLYGRQSRWLRVDLAADDGLEPVLYACGRRLAAAAKSPGQVAKLSLGLLFALRDYYGSACSLLVLDEPVFRVDTSARAPFYGILDSLRQSTETIVLISHESELTGCTFDAHIEARIDDTGISSLVEV